LKPSCLLNGDAEFANSARLIESFDLKIMKLEIENGVESINWVELCELIRIAPLGTRDPDRLIIASKNSFVVCSAYTSRKIVGFGRALSDGQ